MSGVELEPEEESGRGELDRRVELEIEELRLAGRLYKFTPESRCKVCRQEDTGVVAVVNKLLAAGESYASVLRDIEVFNSELAKTDQITYDSIRNHHKKHFNTDHAAAAVYRRILEKNAAEADIDFVQGVKNAVTPLAYLETVMNKGYQETVTTAKNVSVSLGMDAAIKLHELTRDESDHDVQELVQRTNRLIEIVREVVPVSYWEEIVSRIDKEDGQKVTREQVIDAVIEEDFDDEDFDDEEDL